MCSNVTKAKIEYRLKPDIIAKIPTVYIFEVQLDHAVLPVWRILELPRNLSLHELHLAIQVGMGWKCCHLYDLRFRGKRYEFPEPMTRVTDEVGNPRVVKLMNLDLKLGESFNYTYDFGDSWEHTITLKGFSRKEYGFKDIPRCSAGAMACPPEDIGGIPVYNTLVRFLKDKEPMTIYPNLEKMMKHFDIWKEDIPSDYSFGSVMRHFWKRYK